VRTRSPIIGSSSTTSTRASHSATAGRRTGTES
jgi:hypothetical protein